MPSIKKAAGKSKLKTGTDKDFTKARERLDKKRLKRDRDMHWAHFWNVCPKCGGDMFEQKASHIYFEVCRSCHGIYIDSAELDFARKHFPSDKIVRAMLLKAKKPKTSI
jgi:hypothetical protein